MHSEVNIMIDILKAKKVFAEYVKAYDAENDKIKINTYWGDIYLGYY